MSALGQKHTFGSGNPMSALPPKADIVLSAIAMSALCQKQTFAEPVRRHPSVRKTSLPQALGEFGKIVRSTKRKHFVQIRNA
jgi:hypothetical protein